MQRKSKEHKDLIQGKKFKAKRTYLTLKIKRKLFQFQEK